MDLNFGEFGISKYILFQNRFENLSIMNLYNFTSLITTHSLDAQGLLGIRPYACLTPFLSKQLLFPRSYQSFKHLCRSSFELEYPSSVDRTSLARDLHSSNVR